MGSRIMIVYLLACLAITAEAAYQGCYTESVRRRHFSVSPGDYNPELMTTLMCASSCGLFSYQYAAITSGKFCYCANQLPTSGKVSDSACDIRCEGDPSQGCGGARHVSVFSATIAITGLSLKSDAEGTIIPVGRPVILDVSITSGNDVIYSFDYDDGSATTSPNASTMLTTIYNSPGEYTILVYATDLNRTLENQVAATTVRADAPPGAVEIQCDPVFGTFEEGVCTCTVWAGSSMTLTVRVHTVSLTLSIEDPPLSLAGPAVNDKVTTAGDGQPAVYLLQAAEFSVAGRILGWEMVVFDTQPGTSLQILLLKPGCPSNNYCYSSNSCSSSCTSATSRVTSCLAGDQFCVQSASCQPACTAPGSRYPASNMNYEVVKVIAVQTSGTGYQYVQENQLIEVQPGYILGIQQSGTRAVLNRLACPDTNQCDRQSNTQTAPEGSQHAMSSASTLSVRHAVRAIASAGSKVYLPLTFDTAGNFTMTAEASSSSLQTSYPSKNSTEVVVLEGVNATIITAPQFGATGDPVTFTVEPHTGNNVFYNWTFSDNDVFVAVTDRIKTHAFAAKGNYSVNVTAYNAVSEKSNITDITIQDKVAGLALTTEPTALGQASTINFTMTDGSDYTCSWDYGDKTAKEQTDETSTPKTLTSKLHTYRTTGDFLVVVTCSNQVSSVTQQVTVKVLEAITNLRMISSGAQKGQDFTLDWQVDAGTDLTCVVTFDGRSLTSFSSISKYVWRSSTQPGRAASSIPLSIACTNLVSRADITVNFQILSVIVSPTLTTAKVNLSSHEPVDFTVNMLAGSDVTVIMDYGDSDTSNYTQQAGVEWDRPVNMTHTYKNGGRFTVTATISNAAGSYGRSVQVLVLVGVGAIDCQMVDYSLYHPPAFVNLTFNASVMPTEPTLILNWGEPQSLDINPGPLQINVPYKHIFGDTGTFTVKANLTNLIGHKMCIMNITIVEKLSGPHFMNKFTAAAKGMPYSSTFCLYRGPSGHLCNLTYNFGDGSADQLFQRLGTGKDGCDTHDVVYTDTTTKIVTVTATTYLETVSARVSVPVIVGVKDTDIVITNTGNTHGTATTFTLTNNGADMPDNAFVKFDFGDGSTKDVGPTALTAAIRGGTQSFGHIYEKDGVFETKVTIYNQATAVEKVIQVGVFKAFLNLRTEVFYLADTPPGAVTYGLNGKNNLFPSNKPLNFRVSDTNQAFATDYQLTLTNGITGAAVSYTFTLPEFNVTISESGHYSYAITAKNPRNTAVTSSSLDVIELVQGLSITEDKAKVKANENKVFTISFIATGTDTCLYIDFGDGSKSVFSDVLATCSRADFSSVPAADRQGLKGLALVQHVYTSQGFYTLNATAENSQSSQTSAVGFSISGLDCSKPAVDIHNRKDNFAWPAVQKRSDRITVQGLSNIYCVLSYENTKSWRAEYMNESYNTVISDVPLTGLDTTIAELNIPARFLKLGLYRFYYSMTMKGAYGSSKFQAETYTYIKVIQSDLVGVMMTGSPTWIERGQAQTLVLNPLENSLDLELDPTSLQGLAVTSWSCERLDNSSTECVAAGFKPTGQSQTLTLSALQIDQTYRLTAVLGKDTRTTRTLIYVTIVAGNPPIVAIQPIPGSVFYQLPTGYKILRSSRFAMDCTCTSCTAAESIDYLWTVYLDDYRWPNSWRVLEPSDLEGRVLGATSKQISIQTLLFELFSATKMRLECQVTAKGQSGNVSVQLEVSRPPIPGTCVVSPLNRTITTENAWRLTVDGWTDADDSIAEFQFFTHVDDTTVDKQVTSVQTSVGHWELSVSLSEGPDYNNYQQLVLVKARDTLGATQILPCGTVVVRPIPVDEIRAIARNIISNQLHEVKRMFAEGDQKTCTEKATNIVSLLNSDKYAGQKIASNFASSMYGATDQGRPSYMQQNASVQTPELEYKMETERNDRAAVRTLLINEVTKQSPQSVVGIQQQCSFLAEVLIFGDEISQASQKTVIGAVGEMMKFLTNPENTVNVPSEEMEIVLESVMAIIGEMYDSLGNNGKYGLRSDLKLATKDKRWLVYDTDIDSMGGDDDFSEADSFEEAMVWHTARINRIRQEQVALQGRQQLLEALDQQVACFSRISVPGQTLQCNSVKMKQVLEKTSVDHLSGMQLLAPGSAGGVVFPNISFLDSADSDDPIVVAVSQSTNFPLRYSDTAKGISPYSSFITISLYGANNTKLSVQNLSEPMTVTIPADAHLKEPNYVDTSPIIASWSTLMTYTVNLTRPQSAIHMDFKNMEGKQLLLVVKIGKLANIARDPANDECDYVSLLPLSMTTNLDDKNRYRFYINNAIIGNFTGLVSIGVRELNSTETDMDISKGCASLPRYPNGSNYFTGNFSLRMFVTQCLVMSDTSDDWTTNGCVVGIDTTVFQTVCHCTHLTTFAGGWVVVPNTIDWSYVFAHADFLTNPTIYITVIVTAALYVIFALLARYKDKKLAEKLGIAPLPDNDPRDKYFYEIIVSTGMRRNAGTDSQVCFILSGEDDETDVRAFSDSKRKIFRRGQVDGFLMAVPRPLGYLNFIRVWHDNSGRGKFGSWYLNYLMIRDIQTDVKQVFIANKWFAVEEADGQVDRVIPVANREQMADFSYQFGERSKKDFADGHLWFSVVARPANSRFTCLQRVSCCLCLLYLTMLTNAMFYNTTSSQESASNSFTFGPFSLSPEEIFIGVISNLIVFPVNFLLVFLFKKSRPHHKRPSRIDLAIKEVYDQNRQTNLNDIKPEVSSIFSVAKSPCMPKDPHGPDTSVSRPGTAMSNTSTEELTPRKKKKKFELPWYCTILAWLLLWVVTLGSLALVIFYGISFKDEVCKKWITSMVVSFFMSVFVTQPIKVVMFAIIMSLIVRNPAEEEEDEEEDEELPHIDQDSELLHAMDLTRPRKIGYKPPDPQLLEKLRAKRLKEIKMWEIIREVIIYSFFLWILMVISYRQMGASNFLYKNTMYKVFIDNKNTDIDFNAIRNADEFWKWAKSGMVNGIRAGAYYNDYPPLKLRAYINDKVSRILGYATMRQLRIKPSQCEVPGPVQGLIPECNVNYYMFDQEESTFRPGWQPMRPGDTVNDTKPEYIYTPAEELNGYPYWGILSWYSGGGYVVDLKASKNDLVVQMEQLEQDKWIDRYTRAVFVEFAVYNPQVNLFAIGTILAEFHPSGGLVASARFEPAMLLPYMTSAMLFQIVCEIIYMLFVVFFIIRELRELIKMKLSYFRSFWNMVEVGVIAMSIAAIVIFFYRMTKTNELTTRFKETLGNGYVKFQYVAYWNETFSYMIGFLCFLATIKFLKLLRFNRKMSMLSATLKFSAWSLFNFGIIFLIVFLAFAQLFYLTYMHIDIDYATFISSMVSGILMMMGRYDIYSMIMAEPVLTQIFVLLFVITVTFILVNMFVTILNETFAAVREDINKQGNDYEIVDFMLLRFKQWTGLGKEEDHTLPPGGPDDLNNLQIGANSSDHVENFPDRIERLLKTISSVYMDNDNLAMLYQKKPYESQHGNKNLLRTGLSPAPGTKQRRKASADVIARVQTH